MLIAQTSKLELWTFYYYCVNQCIFLKEDFVRKSTKTTLFTNIYIYIKYISPPAEYTNTIYNSLQNKVLTMDIHC